MKKVIFGIIFILILQACSSVKPEKEVSVVVPPSNKSKDIKKIALLLGVSDYAGQRNDLNGIYKDIDMMRELFSQKGFKTIILFDSDSMDIVDYLEKYKNQLSSKDSFVFYYSGHGSHVKDKNGDEKDGRDETLVLSDGTLNKHLLDDTIDSYFAAIKAKKLMIFDSCHSGTVSKQLSKSKAQSKTISSKAITMTLPAWKEDIMEEELRRGGDYIVLSSSKDNEESLATAHGSLFTVSLYKILLDEKQKSFNDVIKIIGSNILTFCKKDQSIPHHPQISSSKSSLKESSIKEYFGS